MAAPVAAAITKTIALVRLAVAILHQLDGQPELVLNGSHPAVGLLVFLAYSSPLTIVQIHSAALAQQQELTA